MNHYTVSNNHARPVFDSKISKPILPPISFEPERKINFPYESNYTYLNQTYLYDVEKYPEYLELAESLVQLSNSSTMPYHRVSKPAHFPPLYPHQVVEPTSPKDNEEAAFERQQREQRAYEQQHYHQQYLPPYQSSYPPYPAFMASPSATVVNILPPSAYPTYIPEQPVTPPKKHTKFIPITPPSSKSTKSKAEPLKSPTKNHPPRVCISCGSDQSPCWRPSWSSKEGQLCNSCGLRYKKTSARCLNNSCKKIPAKGEWSLMQTKGVTTFDDGSEGYGCLECGNKVEVKK
ncbi:hypothetical protein CANTEDRAFT_134124 [Yamadazyma tenuis ATCC 10573]|nr:uncharacterized protein CANTEDRAFT_134124 [Yamadazyma tenuis ATCC 10573]EGV64822.1 hypothetical protein CANTEDRAFT_134124 [Yamadazyma tenuis ATCC 10573]